MTPEKLLAAVDTITEVTNVFSSYPEDRAKAVEAQLFLTMANNYLIELAHHISKGVEPYDAVMKTLHGEHFYSSNTSSGCARLYILRMLKRSYRCTDNFKPAAPTTASKVLMVGLPFVDSAR